MPLVRHMFGRNILFLIIGMSMLVFFGGFSRYVGHGKLARVDFDITVKIQDKIPKRFDQLMDDGAVLADGIVSSVLVLGITGWALFRWKKKGIWLAALAIPAGFFILGVLEIYGKNILPHPGPPFFMLKQPTTIFPKFHVAQPFSYPSGHAGRITFLAVIVGAIIYRRLAKNHQKKMLMLAAIAGYALFVWVSRIYLGHHWLSDILGGILLGGATSLAAVGFLL